MKNKKAIALLNEKFYDILNKTQSNMIEWNAFATKFRQGFYTEFEHAILVVTKIKFLPLYNITLFTLSTNYGRNTSFNSAAFNPKAAIISTWHAYSYRLFKAIIRSLNDEDNLKELDKINKLFDGSNAVQNSAMYDRISGSIFRKCDLSQVQLSVMSRLDPDQFEEVKKNLQDSAVWAQLQ